MGVTQLRAARILQDPGLRLPLCIRFEFVPAAPPAGRKRGRRGGQLSVQYAPQGGHGGPERARALGSRHHGRERAWDVGPQLAGKVERPLAGSASGVIYPASSPRGPLTSRGRPHFRSACTHDGCPSGTRLSRRLLVPLATSGPAETPRRNAAVEALREGLQWVRTADSLRGWELPEACDTFLREVL